MRWLQMAPRRGSKRASPTRRACGSLNGCPTRNSPTVYLGGSYTRDAKGWLYHRRARRPVLTPRLPLVDAGRDDRSACHRCACWRSGAAARDLPLSAAPAAGDASQLGLGRPGAEGRSLRVRPQRLSFCARSCWRYCPEARHCPYSSSAWSPAIRARRRGTVQSRKHRTFSGSISARA